jgi:Ion channel
VTGSLQETFWVAGYVGLGGTVVMKSIVWLFFAVLVTRTAVQELWMLSISFGIVFSIWLGIGIAKNLFRPMMAKFMVALLMLELLCNWIMAYAVAYRHWGVIDKETEVRDSITCFYFSIVTWTTLGYGDVRPSIDARLIAASEALFGYIWMAAFIGMFAGLFRQWVTEIGPELPNEVKSGMATPPYN